MPFTHETASKPRVTAENSRLQQIRLEQGLRQSEIAEVLDVSATQWQRWERGKSPVPKLVWLALKGLYGVDVTEELKAFPAADRAELIRKAVIKGDFCYDDAVDTVLSTLRMMGHVMLDDFTTVPAHWRGATLPPKGEGLPTYTEEFAIVERFVQERCGL